MKLKLSETKHYFFHVKQYRSFKNERNQNYGTIIHKNGGFKCSYKGTDDKQQKDY